MRITEVIVENTQGVAEAAGPSLEEIIQAFVKSPVGQQYKKHDCKTVTRAFVQWAEQNNIPTEVITFAPPSAEFIAKNPKFKGKSGEGDGHIMPIVNGNAIDFTVRQFGVGRPFENPLVTPVGNLKSVYGKFGYYTDAPEWFLGGKSFWQGPLKSIPNEIFNQNFGDELLEQGVAEGSLDDIEDTKQFKAAIALAKSQKAIRQAKYGKDQKFYADGTPVTPEEIARRAAERKAKKSGVAEGQLDPYRLERLDPQSRRVLQRMADHAEPGSWLSASEAYAIMLGLQYKSRNPRGWEQEVQGYVDLWKEITGGSR